mgnify:CR=1 FL=1
MKVVVGHALSWFLFLIKTKRNVCESLSLSLSHKKTTYPLQALADSVDIVPETLLALFFSFSLHDGRLSYEIEIDTERKVM